MKRLQDELEKLKGKVFSLSEIVEDNVIKSLSAVRNKNETLAKRAIENDYAIDLKEVEIEEACLKVLALHQPVAVDLRLVVAILKINNDLERIGDLAVNIAERALYLTRKGYGGILFNFEAMGDKTISMFKYALQALLHLDTKLAYGVCHADDEIDDLNREVYEHIYQEIQQKPESVKTLIHNLSISRHLERIADYTTNIAEDVIYMVEGKIIRHKAENFQIS